MVILMMVMMLITQYQVTKTVDPRLKLGQLTLHLTQSTLSHQQSEKPDKKSNCASNYKISALMRVDGRGQRMIAACSGCERAADVE